jgi:elongation factor P
LSISTNDLKNGMALNLPSEGLVTVVEFQHVKPGKGGAFVRTKLKKVAGGSVLERTFRADEKVPLAVIDKREMQYLYREGDSLVFMDSESYDQLNVATKDLGSAVDFLKEGDTAILHMYEGAVGAAELPAAVELTVAQTEPGVQGDRVSGARKPATLETGLVVQVPLFVEPGVQGDRVSGARKPATLETGLVVQVPLFIEAGEKITVDTRTGEYLARA